MIKEVDVDGLLILYFNYAVIPKFFNWTFLTFDSIGDGRIDFYEFVHALGEPEDSQENEEDDELFSPLPVTKSITANDCDDNLSQ